MIFQYVLVGELLGKPGWVDSLGLMPLSFLLRPKNSDTNRISSLKDDSLSAPEFCGIELRSFETLKNISHRIVVKTKQNIEH